MKARHLAGSMCRFAAQESTRIYLARLVNTDLLSYVIPANELSRVALRRRVRRRWNAADLVT